MSAVYLVLGLIAQAAPSFHLFAPGTRWLLPASRLLPRKVYDLRSPTHRCPRPRLLERLPFCHSGSRTECWLPAFPRQHRNQICRRNLLPRGWEKSFRRFATAAPPVLSVCLTGRAFRSSAIPCRQASSWSRLKTSRSGSWTSRCWTTTRSTKMRRTG